MYLLYDGSVIYIYKHTYISLLKGNRVIRYWARNRVGTANVPKIISVVLIEFYLASECVL